MRSNQVESRWSPSSICPAAVSPVVAVLALGLLVACSNSSASTASQERVASQSQATAAPASRPQQVVQRIEPVPDAAPAAARGLQAAGGASAGRTQSEGQQAQGPRPEGITSRHLEAELNRLEAELEK